MPNGTYGGVRGRKTKEVGGKTSKILCFPPTRFLHPGVSICIYRFDFLYLPKYLRYKQILPVAGLCCG